MIEDLRWIGTTEGWILEAYDGYQWFRVKCANEKDYAPVFNAVGFQINKPTKATTHE